MSKVEQYDFSEERDEVLRKFNRLIEIGKQIGNQLKNNKFKCFMNTPYEYYKLLKSSDFKSIKQPSNTPNAESLRGFAKGILKHYDVNPSIEENNQKIINTYVYDSRSIAPLLRGLHCANEQGINPDFYNQIREIIINIKQGTEIQSEEKTIYITGTRGSGKTTFFNYFTSRYEKELNEQSIITVRVNVRRIPNGVRLVDAIRFKLCRILFTYYCSWTYDSKRMDILKNRNRKNYIDSILKSFVVNQQFKEESINSCLTFFCEYNIKELMAIPPEYLDICKKLLAEISKEYKYIVMLDNFDQLYPNNLNKNDYEGRKKELESDIKETLIFNHSVFLIAVRYGTFRGLKFVGRKKPEIWSIGVPSTFDMINKRINYFIKNSSQSDDDTKMQREKYIVHCIKYIGRNFLQEDRELSFEGACSEIDSIYAENKRAIIHIIGRFIDANFRYEINTHEIDSHLIRNNYKFFETLPIDTNNGYCKLFYEYSLNGEELIFGNIHPSAFHDHNYMPNIYKFPSFFGNENMMFAPFLKIRILQLLKNCEDKGIDGMSPKTIRTILNNLFSYRNDAIKLACIELREDLSIISKNDKYEYEPDKDSIPMEITDRGKKLLEILPVNPNILAICLEHIYFPKNCLQGMPIGNYYEDLSNDEKFSNNYIIRNIFCSLPRAIGLFISIEQAEKQMFSEITAKPSKSEKTPRYDRYFNLQNDFSFTEQLENSARTIIGKIFNSHFINPDGIENEREAIYRGRRNELIVQLSKAINHEQL
jgi:hypothetical protein